MRYQYENSFKVYKEAVRTYIRTNPKRRFWFHFQMWGMLVLGIVVLLFAATTSALIQYGSIFAPLVGGLIGGGIVCPILRPWGLRRSYKTWNGEAEGRLVYFEIADGELRGGVEGRAESRFQRAAICATAEDESMLLLFLNKKKFFYLPKHLLPQDVFDEVRGWLQLPGGNSKC